MMSEREWGRPAPDTPNDPGFESESDFAYESR